MSEWIFFVALSLAVFGLVLYLLGWSGRKRSGLSAGETVALDNVNLFSKQYLLAGRPDRIVRIRGSLVPEEWKSSRSVHPSHIIQLGAYFLLIQEAYGIRPRYGVIVLGGKKRHKIRNTKKLERQVVEIAEAIRAARRQIDEAIRVSPQPSQCRACGQRSRCRQSKA